jgi:hypothetical protein
MHAIKFKATWAGHVEMRNEVELSVGKPECTDNFVGLYVGGKIRWIIRISVFGCKLDASGSG